MRKDYYCYAGLVITVGSIGILWVVSRMPQPADTPNLAIAGVDSFVTSEGGAETGKIVFDDVVITTAPEPSGWYYNSGSKELVYWGGSKGSWRQKITGYDIKTWGMCPQCIVEGRFFYLVYPGFVVWAWNHDYCCRRNSYEGLDTKGWLCYCSNGHAWLVNPEETSCDVCGHGVKK